MKIHNLIDEKLFNLECFVINTRNEVQFTIITFLDEWLIQTIDSLNYPPADMLLLQDKLYIIMQNGIFLQYTYQVNQIIEIKLEINPSEATLKYFQQNLTISSDKQLLIINDEKQINLWNLPSEIFIQNDQITIQEQNQILSYQIDYEQNEVNQKARYSLPSHIQKIVFIHFFNQNFFLILNASQVLYAIYQPNLQDLMKVNFGPQKEHTEIYKPPFQTPKPAVNQICLFEKIKKFTNQNLDTLIAKAIQVGDHRSLLLICSRIRNYKIFFNQVYAFPLPCDLKLLKDCECFDRSLLKEEFVEAIIEFSSKKPVIATPYLRFLIESPHLINDSYYLSLLEIPIKREMYQINKLNIPYVPNYTMIKMKAYEKCLESAKKAFQKDFYDMKHKILKKYQFIQLLELG